MTNYFLNHPCSGIICKRYSLPPSPTRSCWLHIWFAFTYLRQDLFLAIMEKIIYWRMTTKDFFQNNLSHSIEWFTYMFTYATGPQYLSPCTGWKKCMRRSLQYRKKNSVILSWPSRMWGANALKTWYPNSR